MKLHVSYRTGINYYRSIINFNKIYTNTSNKYSYLSKKKINIDSYFYYIILINYL